MGATEAIAPANDDLQGSLPIADIKYGVVRTRDGGYAALFEVLPTNYFLQSTAERIRIISSLAAWLRIAPDNLQILCLSQPVDVEQYTRRMEGFLQSEGDALCRTCIEDNINEVNQLVRYGAFTTRFYIAYRYEPSMVSGDVSYAKIAAALRQVMDSSVSYLARCGLNVVSPGYIDNHLVETVFRMLCKRTSEHIRLPLYFRDMLQECYGVPQQPEPDPEGGEETTTGAAKQDTSPEAKEQKNTGRRRKQQKTSEQFEVTGVMDLICPAAVDFTHKDYIEMDGVCHAYLYIAGYGYKSLVRGGWMAALAGMGDGISVSMTLQRRSREKILPKVANSTIWSRSRIRDVDNTRADFEQMDSAITAGIYIKDQMNRAGEDYYDMYTLIEVTADDPELLETRVSDVERHCTSLELIVKRCDYLEEQALHSFLPVVSMAPEIERKARRNALLSGVASAFPFYSMELCEQNGILIGQDMQRKSICMLDIFDSDRYNNANTIVLGTSGAGKTFLLQLIAMRYRQQGKQVCLIAPYKGYEYRAACEAIGGLYIKLAPSSTDCINFMEIREESLRARQQEESEQERNRSLLADKISQLHIFTDLMDLILSRDNILLAYRNIKANGGSYTAGTDNSNITDIGCLPPETVVEKVRFIVTGSQHGYRPKPVRRKDIPKPNGKTRPLGIPCIWDRLIQQCIKQVMEPICEAKFSDNSYGFRPNRSVEHAIQKTYTMLQRMNLHYVIEFDIKGFFDNVNHSKLVRQIWASP